jgi:APA family basic amino acid/polyamine antiporter
VQNFTNAVTVVASKSSALLTAVCATAFAYEGWVIATSINAELRDSKKNLPIALVAGAAIVIVVYILYYVGLAVWFRTQRSWKTVRKAQDRVLYVVLQRRRNIAVRVSSSSPALARSTAS